MENLCPLCMKNGIKSRIKSFQINLEEAVWACESEKCIWPMGYEDMIFFKRKAISCNWEESNLFKKTPLPMELSLYTPPVTPGGGETSKESTDINAENFANTSIEDKLCEILDKNESICSKKELVDASQLLSKPFNLESNNVTEKSRYIKEKVNACASSFRTLPENTRNGNVGSLCISGYYDNKKVDERKRQFTDMEMTGIGFDLLLDDSYKEIYLSMQCKEDNEPNKSDTMQLNDTTSRMEIDRSTEILSQTIKSTIDVNVTNNQNTSSGTDTSGDINIETILEDILTNETNITESIDDDWLTSLIS